MLEAERPQSRTSRLPGPSPASLLTLPVLATSAPSVTFNGGGATTEATGHLLGGVDAVDCPSRRQAIPSRPSTSTCRMIRTASRHRATPCAQHRTRLQRRRRTVTVTGDRRRRPGSGYFAAPNVVIRDGTEFDPINPPAGFIEAKAHRDPEVLSVALDTFGAGYTGSPSVDLRRYRAGTRRSCRRRDRLRRGLALHLLKAGLRLHHPGGIKKFVDTLPGLTPAGVNNLGQYIPLAVPETRLPECRLLRHRGRAASGADELEPARRTLLRDVRPAVDGERARQARRARAGQPDGTTTPGPDARRHQACRRGQPALPRPDHRRDQGPGGPDRLLQPAPEGRRRRPVPPDRHEHHGFRA